MSQNIMYIFYSPAALWFWLFWLFCWSPLEWSLINDDVWHFDVVHCIRHMVWEYFNLNYTHWCTFHKRKHIFGPGILALKESTDSEKSVKVYTTCCASPPLLMSELEIPFYLDGITWISVDAAVHKG